jgi:AcrR family transcriptional regulator
VAARRLFHEQGYGATSLEEVATAADVAIQTVYAIYRSKRGLLFALVDDTARETDAATHRAALAAESDPARRISILVDFAASYFGQVHDVVEILRGAGTADADIGGAWRFGESRRRDKDHEVVGQWARLGVLRLPAAEAEDILWTMTGPDVYRLLVLESGWPPHAYRAWLEQVLLRELLITGGT